MYTTYIGSKLTFLLIKYLTSLLQLKTLLLYKSHQGYDNTILEKKHVNFLTHEEIFFF